MIKKIVSAVVALATVLTVFAGVTAPAFADSMMTYNFQTNLTVGSRSSDVSALQALLNAKGFLAVAPTGYFGTLTKGALAKMQAANGISPAVGYFGPLTRAFVNSMSMSSGTPGCPAGAMYNSMTGAMCGTMTPVPGCPSGAMYNSMTGALCSSSGTPVTPGTPSQITTPGVEGTITVSLNPTPVQLQQFRPGDLKQNILGIKLQANTSDMDVQRIKLDLGNSALFYNKIASNLYIVDENNTVLFQTALNSSTVTQENSEYFINAQNFHFIVPKGTVKVLYVAVDFYSTIDSQYANNSTYTKISVPANGVRASDGKGIDQYGPSTGFTRIFTLNKSSAQLATATISRDAGSVDQRNVVGVRNTYQDIDKVDLLTFKLHAQDDNLLLDNLTVTLASTGPQTIAAVYVTDAISGQILQSASVTAGLNSALLDLKANNVQPNIPQDTDRLFKIQADVRGLTGTPGTVVATVSAVNVENSDGAIILATGSAVGRTQYLYQAAPVFTLVGVSFPTPAHTANGAATDTVTVSPQFTVSVTGKGADILLATSSATIPAFSIGVYNTAGARIASTTLSYTYGGATVNPAGYIVVSINESRTFVITGSYDVSSQAASAQLDYRLDSIVWSASSTSGITNYLGNLDEQNAYKTGYKPVR